MTTTSLGEQGFRWFFAKVLERKNDPLKIGRVRISIFGIHDEDMGANVPVGVWATVVNPIQSASAGHVGVSPVGLLEGSIVFGFFADGAEGQVPVLLGSMNGAPGGVSDIPLEAYKRGVANTPVKGEFVAEPDTAYAAEYPYNKATHSESGHVLELDDTPGEERLHLFHKAGTYVEVNKEGRRVDKIVGDNFEITLKDKHILIKGRMNVEIEGDSMVHVKGNALVDVRGDCVYQSGGVMKIESEKAIIMKAPRIDLNPGAGGGGGNINPNIEAGKAYYAGYTAPNLASFGWGL